VRDVVSFGPFRLYPTERLLEKDAVPIQIGGRALDILIVLAERAGEVVDKRDLVARVWAHVHVDEGSLRFHVATLRKALGDGQGGARYVKNVPGRGYCLVAPISRSNASDPPPKTTALNRSQSLPATIPNMIGRDEVVQKIMEELSSRRFVTIVGPGGIGKTTVAIAVGHRMLSVFDGIVCFLDVGSISDGHLIPSVLASMLGLLVQSDNPIPNLLAFLNDKRILILLDGCEHVIEPLALLAENIFQKAPQTYILATSRESMRADGESVHRLFPLDGPPQDVVHSVTELAAYPAARMFLERVDAGNADFVVSDDHAASIAEICNKVDGIPLAIELAASQVTAYGIQGVASLLKDRFGLLWKGRRTALSRHQTLSATLDWSFDLLPEFEKIIFRRLSVFVGLFSLEAARAIVADDQITEEQVVAVLADLVAKSLVTPVIDAAPLRYRLLDMTRAYLLTKPIETDAAALIARRHAFYFTQYLDRAASSNTSVNDSGAYAGSVRAALQWCFSSEGDRLAGIELTAAAAPYFLEMSLMTECRFWAEQAIAASSSEQISASREVQLQYALGISLLFTGGSADQVSTALNKALALAESLNDMHAQLRLMSALHIFKTRGSDFVGSLEVSERCMAVAKKIGDPSSIMVAEWLLGIANHLIGNQEEACRQCESAMTSTRAPEWGSLGRLGYDRRIIALVVRARALWLAGRPEQAAEVAKYTIKEGEKLNSAWSFCMSMLYSIPVFIWSGDWMRAEENIERLIAHSANHSLDVYHAAGLGLKGELTIKVGVPAAGVSLLREGLEGAKGIRFVARLLMARLAEGLVMTGQLDEAMATIEIPIGELGGAPASFVYPELLRIKGEVLRSLARSESAETCLIQSLEWGRKQSSLSWELRTAISLARLWDKGKRRADAMKLLSSTYERFSEGFETFDLKTAHALLEQS
jgi:predicted ATPase/DNA-binding winged helix-turn-helix (wHTH) protein